MATQDIPLGDVESVTYQGNDVLHVILNGETIWTPPLATPANFRRTEVTYNSASFAWDDAGPETKYVLQMSDNTWFNSPITYIELPANTTSHVIEGLRFQQSGYVRLRAETQSDVTDWTSKLYFQTGLDGYGYNLFVSNKYTDSPQIDISWRYPGESYAGYVIQRSTDMNNWSDLVELTVAGSHDVQNHYVDDDVTYGTTYYYRGTFVGHSHKGTPRGRWSKVAEIECRAHQPMVLEYSATSTVYLPIKAAWPGGTIKVDWGDGTQTDIDVASGNNITDPVRSCASKYMVSGVNVNNDGSYSRTDEVLNGYYTYVKDNDVNKQLRFLTGNYWAICNYAYGTGPWTQSYRADATGDVCPELTTWEDYNAPSQNFTVTSMETSDAVISKSWNSPANRTISIYGDVVEYGDSSAESSNEKLIGCSSFGDLPLRSLKSAFITAKKLQTIPTSLPVGLTNLENAFYGAFTDRSNVSLDLSGWNVQAVITLGGFLGGCTTVTSVNFSDWDVDLVESFTGMLRTCEGLTSADLSSWDFGRLHHYYQWDHPQSFRNFSNMFSDCPNLVSVNLPPIRSRETHNVFSTNFLQGMFQHCYDLVSIPGVENWDVSTVSNFSDMFTNCRSLDNIDLSGWCALGNTNPAISFARDTSSENEYVPFYRNASNRPLWGQCVASCSLRDDLDDNCVELSHDHAEYKLSEEYQNIINNQE